MRDELRFRATAPDMQQLVISNGRKRELLSNVSNDVRQYQTSVPYDDSPEAFDMYVVHVALSENVTIPERIVTHFNEYETFIPKCTVSQKDEYNKLLTEEVNELNTIISDLNVKEDEPRRRAAAAAAVHASLPRKVLPGLPPFQVFPHPPHPSLVDRVAYNMSNQPQAGVFGYGTGDQEEHARVDLIRSILCHMAKHADNPKKGWRREFDRLYKAHGIMYRGAQPQNWYVANMQIDRAQLLRRAPNPPVQGGGGGGVAAVNPNAANMNAWFRRRGIRKHRRIEPPRGPRNHGGGHMTAMRRAKLLCNSTPFGQFVKFLEHLLRENAYRIEERYYAVHPPGWLVGPLGPGLIPEHGDIAGRLVTVESNRHGAECRRLRTAADDLHQAWTNLLNCMCGNAVLFTDNVPGIGTTMSSRIDNTPSAIVARFPPPLANQSAGGYRRRAYIFNNPVIQDPDTNKSCCIILRDYPPVAAAGARWLHLRRGNSGAPGCGPPSFGQGVYERLMGMVMEILVTNQSKSPDGLVVRMNSAGATPVPPELIDRNVAYDHIMGGVVVGAGGEQDFKVYRTGGPIDDWAGGGTLFEQIRFYWRNAY